MPFCNETEFNDKNSFTSRVMNYVHGEKSPSKTIGEF